MSLRRLQRGSFLLELAVATIILAIGIAFAFPGYNTYVKRLHRTVAKDALIEMGTMEEQYFNRHGIYSTSPSDLGYPMRNTPFAIAGGRYTITGLQTTATSYSITATATGSQADDAACRTFTVASSGVQSSTGTFPSTDCWH